jgi:hypothetical protein
MDPVAGEQDEEDFSENLVFADVDGKSDTSFPSQFKNSVECKKVEEPKAQADSGKNSQFFKIFNFYRGEVERCVRFEEEAKIAQID